MAAEELTKDGYPVRYQERSLAITAWLLHLPQPSTYTNTNTFPKHMTGEDCYRMSNQKSHTCFKGETEYTINTCNQGSQTILGNSVSGKSSMRKWCSHWILHVEEIGPGKEHSRWMGHSVYKLGRKSMAHRKNHRTWTATWEGEEAGKGHIIHHVKNLLFCFKLLKGQGIQWVIFMDTKITQHGGSSVVEKIIMDQCHPWLSEVSKWSADGSNKEWLGVI